MQVSENCSFKKIFKNAAHAGAFVDLKGLKHREAHADSIYMVWSVFCHLNNLLIGPLSSLSRMYHILHDLAVQTASIPL